MKNAFRTFCITATVLISAMAVNAQSIEGIWKTVDDNTGKTKSEVQLEIKNNALYGTIVKLYKEPGENPDPVCNVCEGAFKGKKIIGMQIVNRLKNDGTEWKADNGILDPENGKWYDCKMWVNQDNPNELKVRGYISFLYRTQTWYRVQ